MLVLIAVLLALVPAALVIYPFLRGPGRDELPVDEGSPRSELDRRWYGAVEGLKSAELESAIGNLVQEDYHWLRRKYVMEAALVMKAMRLEQDQEEELLDAIRQEVRQVRMRTLGRDGYYSSITCSGCGSSVEWGLGVCAKCGERVPLAGPGAPVEADPSSKSPSE